MRSVDATITVSPSIKRWYEEHYPDVPVSLVRNVPERSPAVRKDLKVLLGVPANALLFIYVGGLSKGRGIEPMLQAFADASVPHHLLVMGSGSLEPEVEAVVKACSRVHRLPPVSPSEVLEYAAGADVGVCLYEDTCLNHRYCLPNKVFEYLLAGLPVLVSRLPDLGALVASLGAGWQTEIHPAAVVRTLRGITRERCAGLVQGLKERTAGLSWDVEEKSLLGAYDALLARG